MTNSLNGISVEKNSLVSAYLPDFPYWLNCAYLIIGKHDRDQTSIIANGFFNLFRNDQPVAVNIQQGDFKAFFFQLLQCVQDCMVLEGR